MYLYIILVTKGPKNPLLLSSHFFEVSSVLKLIQDRKKSLLYCQIKFQKTTQKKLYTTPYNFCCGCAAQANHTQNKKVAHMKEKGTPVYKLGYQKKEQEI